MFTKSSNLVTGGTGSFGQTFVPMVLQEYDPKRVIVYRRSDLLRRGRQKHRGPSRREGVRADVPRRKFIHDIRIQASLRDPASKPQLVRGSGALERGQEVARRSYPSQQYKFRMNEQRGAARVGHPGRREDRQLLTATKNPGR